MEGEGGFSSVVRPARATSVHVDEAAGRTVVRVLGELDISTLEVLADSMARAVEHAEGVLVVDLRACGFLCSRSFGLLEAAATDLRARGAALQVHDGPHSFRVIREVVGTGSALAAT